MANFYSCPSFCENNKAWGRQKTILLVEGLNNEGYIHNKSG